jgi:hypothetical protein
VELAVREWLSVAGTGFYEKGIVKLCAKFGRVHECALWFVVEHNCASVEQESCVEPFDFYVIFMSWQLAERLFCNNFFYIPTYAQISTVNLY